MPNVSTRITALVAVTMLLPGCSGAPESVPAKSRASAAARVPTAKVERASVRRVTDQPGRVEPIESTPVHAKLAGYVKAVAVDIGDKVARGQVLAELDAPEVEAELQQKRAMADQSEADRKQAVAARAVARAGVISAEAKAAEARAAIRRLDADVARWQAESARTEQLARDSAVTGSLRDETRSKLESARGALEEGRAQARSAEAAQGEANARVEKSEADLAAAVAKVEVARAEVRRFEALSGYLRIVAPYDGIVTRRNIDTGQLTVPGGSAEPLFVVARVDNVTVVVSVPEAEATLVGPGDPARVRLPALDGRMVEGKVTRTTVVLDDATRTLHAEINLPNPDGTLRPGLYSHVTIVADERNDVLTVPASAVVRTAGKTFCVVAVDGHARRREVRLGLGDGVRFEVLSGLSAGDSVVTSGAEALSDGQAVEPATAKP
jgi:HlyD family secretion protein